MTPKRHGQDSTFTMIFHSAKVKIQHALRLLVLAVTLLATAQGSESGMQNQNGLPIITNGGLHSLPLGQPFTLKIQTEVPAEGFDSGQLPSWLHLDHINGVLTGVPPSSEYYIFEVQAHNQAGRDSATYTLNVGTIYTWNPEGQEGQFYHYGPIIDISGGLLLQDDGRLLSWAVPEVSNIVNIANTKVSTDSQLLLLD